MLLVSYMSLQENCPGFIAEKDGPCYLVHLPYFIDEKVGQ